MELSDVIIVGAIVIEIVNTILLLLLTKVFWDNYRELRSPFTKGLLLFSSALILKSIFTLVYYLTYYIVLRSFIQDQFNISPVGIAPFVINLFECFALIMLLRVTRK